MSCMSGALADFVGRDLFSDSQEVVVSSGGDTFVRASSPINVYLYAKGSPLHERLILAMPQYKRPYGISTVVPGRGVHAVTVASRSACWASAFAQDISDRLSAGEALASVLNRAESYKDVCCIMVIAGQQIIVAGEMILKSANGKPFGKTGQT